MKLGGNNLPFGAVQDSDDDINNNNHGNDNNNDESTTARKIYLSQILKVETFFLCWQSTQKSHWNWIKNCAATAAFGRAEKRIEKKMEEK